MPRAEERFYKLSLTWTEDPKVAHLARFGAVEGHLAAHLFSELIRYSRKNLTDGVGPAEVLASLMSGLGDEQARQLAEYLADPGEFGPLCELRHDGDGRILTWKVLAYAKWNDTRAEVRARIEAGRAAAKVRWDGAGSNADRNAHRTAGRNAGRNPHRNAGGNADA